MNYQVEQSDTLHLDIPPATVGADYDRITRNQASASAVEAARAAMRAEQGAEMAVLPMCWPGKTMGIWQTGQEVVTIPVPLLCVKGYDGHDNLPGYSWTRNAASDIGKAWLKGMPGVSGWAVVYRDSTRTVPVFEGDEVSAS